MTAPRTLDVSDNLRLPVEAVTETFAFLAKRGAGKTYAAKVLAEEMLAAGAQVVVLTPLDVWWGLRSSADGASGGFPIAVLGGSHGDIPLEPPGGQLVARLAVEQGLSMVLTLDGWSKADQRRFAADFLETLFQHNAEPMHLILEEADRWAPQRPVRGEERLLGAAEEIVRRGRSKGIGCTLVTQRSAVLHKDVLTQTEVLVAMRTPAKHDRNAIDAWFEAHDAGDVDPDAAMAELPSLATGEAWVSSPYWFPSVGLPGLVKVRFREATTFDSSATPTVGERTHVARTFADVDLAAIKEEMAATIERAKADDPKELRKRIRALERELAERPAETAVEKVVETVTERVEVPVLDRSTLDRLAALDAFVGEMAALRREIESALERWADGPERDDTRRREAQPAQREARGPSPRAAGAASARGAQPPAPSDAAVSGPMRKLLAVLATYGPRTKRQLAMQAGYSARGGGFNNPLSALRSAGLVERGDPIAITQAGLDALGEYEGLPSGPALLEHWMGQLSGPERKILQPLIDAHPRRMSKEELADAAGYAPVGGGFNNPLSRLRTLELVTRGPDIGLTEDFAEAIR